MGQWLGLSLPGQRLQILSMVEELRSHMPSSPKNPKYKKKQYPVNIVLSNSQTDKTSLSVVHGDNGIFNIDPNEGYAYKTASCTNGQSFTYTTHKFINKKRGRLC